MLGTPDVNEIISDEVKLRVNRMESRMVNYFGRFTEMSADTLACIVNDLEDKQIMAVPEKPKAPEPTPEEYISKMPAGAVLVELEKRGIKLTGKESIPETRELLIKSVTKHTEKKEETE